ncbi:MAG: DUF2330 domain-containing protein [Pirellulaceae bacterium]|nr:DUF2330 domain-containing protein [Pirellulaceae bacterium]
MQICKCGLVVYLVLLISVPGRLSLLHACCPAFARGDDVKIADQNILIVWDPETKVEHFVREAGFKQHRSGEDTAQSDSNPASNFGFLVPSPTQPKIEAASAEVFTRLAEQIRPRIDHQDKWQVVPTALLAWPFLLLKEQRMMTSAPAAGFVQLLEQTQVAGYDVAVLKADDATALSQWLESHGYDARPNLTEWAEPYVAKGWIITAFKYSSQSDHVAADAVRMSFETDRPIFPYRVPVDQIAPQGKGNLLRTYVVGPGRAKGTLGEGTDAAPWNQSRVRYAQQLNYDVTARLLQDAVTDQPNTAKPDKWLTAFDDRTWPSGTQDLWFDFDQNSTPVQEVKLVVSRHQFFIPLDLIAFAGVVVIFIRRRRRRVEL